MKKGLWFIISITIVIADQITKHWAQMHLIAYQPEPLMPAVNLTLAYNTGAAFSFLSGVGGWHRWLFASFSIIMSVALIVWLSRLPKQAFLLSLALSLILGGALGNLYDRALFGYVIDFIDVYYKNYHWPVFNLADTAVCIGAVLLLIDLGRNKAKTSS